MAIRQPVRAFIDHPVTDLAAATAAAGEAAAAWGLQPPTLLRAGMNAIFATPTRVLRVSEPTAPGVAAIELCDFLRGEGLSVPVAAETGAIDVGALSVTCWERIDPTDQRIDWRAVGEMVRRVHRLDRSRLPPSVPLPRPDDFPWWDFETLFERVGDDLDVAAAAGLRAAVDRDGGWVGAPDRVVCHGDVHPGNVMMTRDGPVLIDWDLLCWGPPGWDHGPMMTWETRWGGAAGEYEAFAEGYGASLRGDPDAESIAELRLVAATLMRIIAGQRDPTAMPEAQQRLRYWRGDPDAPTWRAR